MTSSSRADSSVSKSTLTLSLSPRGRGQGEGVKTISNQEFCKKCQKCCKWPGFVYVDEARVQEIARFLSLKPEEVLDRYCTLEEKRLVLKSKANAECIFLSPEGCAIYAVRPWRCVTFPGGWKEEEGVSECPLLQQ